MVLGKSLFGTDQSLLLGSGQVIKDSYIQKIKRLGYQGVYISDGLSDEIVIESLISDQLKISAVKAIKDVFISSKSDDDCQTDDAIAVTKEIVDGLINEILFNRNLMVNMVDLKIFDDYTFYHSVNVAVLSLIVGISIDMPRSELYKLGLGALLHDIGKVFINKDILSKEGPLNEDEFEEIKKHPVLGYEYLTDHYDVPSKSNLGALHHHEKYDGSGYPSSLKDEDISDFGRIIAVADVYDALTSDRPYRKALLPSDAMEYIMGGSGTMFDPLYVLKFTRKVAAYPLGTIVRLSNGVDGIVVHNYEDCCTRPCLRLVEDNDSGEHLYIDLKDDMNATNLTITEIVSK
jgi:HD-GYP domain-containing protein (c-di-GMP phosphodiesterase class II)